MYKRKVEKSNPHELIWKLISFWNKGYIKSRDHKSHILYHFTRLKIFPALRHTYQKTTISIPLRYLYSKLQADKLNFVIRRFSVCLKLPHIYAPCITFSRILHSKYLSVAFSSKVMAMTIILPIKVRMR